MQLQDFTLIALALKQQIQECKLFILIAEPILTVMEGSE